MQWTKELLEKAKTAESAEELLELAKAEGVELTAGDAEKAFAGLHKSGELADEELDNVAGGGCGNGDPSPSGVVDSEDKVVFLYNVGDQVEVFNGLGTLRAHITERYVSRAYKRYAPCYWVEIQNDKAHRDIAQDDIQLP